MTVHCFSGFTLDERRHELTYLGRPVRLAPQPFRLLVALAARGGELVTRAELERALWDESTHVDATAGLNFVVRTLRRALADAGGGGDWIETVPRVGYRLRADGGAPESAAMPPQPSPSDAAGAEPAPLLGPGRAARSPRPVSLIASAFVALCAAAAIGFVVADGRGGAEAGTTLVVDVRSDGRPDTETIARVFEAELVAALIDGAGGRGDVAVGATATAPRGARRLEARWLEIPSGLRADLRLVRDKTVVECQQSIELSRDRWYYGRSTFAEGIGREVAERIWPARPDRATPDSPELARVIARFDSREPGAAAAALEALEALVVTDPANARAHGFLAAARMARWDLAGAEAAARRSLELDPATAEAERTLAGVLSARGRHDDALAAAWRARRLAPLEPRTHFVLARALFFAGRNEEVVGVTDAGLALFPESRGLWRWRYLALLALGDTARAGEALASGLRLSAGAAEPDRSLENATLAAIRSAWRAELDGSRGLTIESPASRAALHALLGERDAAVAELERSIAAREESAVFFAVAPWFEGLRDDPRFREIVRRVTPESRG